MSLDGGAGGVYVGGVGGTIYRGFAEEPTGTRADWFSPAGWGRIFSFGSGTGKSAARGRAVAAAKAERLRAGAEALQRREDVAMRAFEAQTPGGVGQTVVYSVDPKVEKLAKTIQEVQQLLQTTSDVRKQKKLLKREAALEAKQQRQMLKHTERVEVRVANLYGANAGYWQELGAPPPLWLTQRSV